FTRSGAAFTSGVARWGGAAWQPLGSGVAPTLSMVNAIHEFSDGAGHGLIVAGEFQAAGGKASVNTALWRNGQWEALSGTVPSVVNSLARDPNSPGAILAGGGVHGEAVHLTRLANSTTGWRPLSNGVTGTVNGAYAAATHSVDGAETLVIGGELRAAAGGAVTINHVAGWDGQR